MGLSVKQHILLFMTWWLFLIFFVSLLSKIGEEAFEKWEKCFYGVWIC
jgi:hypothetical protein